MFNDMKLSKEIMNDFNKTLDAKTIQDGNSALEFKAEVLTGGHWPEQS